MIVCIIGFVACCYAEGDVMGISLIDDAVVLGMLAAAVAAEAHAADVGIIHTPFHTGCDPGAVASAVIAENLNAHNEDIGESTVDNGTGAVGTMAFVIFGITVIVDEVVAAADEPAGEQLMVTVNTGVDNCNDDGGKVVHILSRIVVDPGVVVIGIYIVRTVAPGHIVVVAGNIVGLSIALNDVVIKGNDGVGLSIFNIAEGSIHLACSFCFFGSCILDNALVIILDMCNGAGVIKILGGLDNNTAGLEFVAGLDPLGVKTVSIDHSVKIFAISDELLIPESLFGLGQDFGFCIFSTDCGDECKAQRKGEKQCKIFFHLDFLLYY